MLACARRKGSNIYVWRVFSYQELTGKQIPDPWFSMTRTKRYKPCFFCLLRFSFFCRRHPLHHLTHAHSYALRPPSARSVRMYVGAWSSWSSRASAPIAVRSLYASMQSERPARAQRGSLISQRARSALGRCGHGRRTLALGQHNAPSLFSCPCLFFFSVRYARRVRAQEMQTIVFAECACRKALRRASERASVREQLEHSLPWERRSLHGSSRCS